MKITAIEDVVFLRVKPADPASQSARYTYLRFITGRPESADTHQSQRRGTEDARMRVLICESDGDNQEFTRTLKISQVEGTHTKPPHSRN